MVPAVEIGVVEELSSYGVSYLALMKCLMEHVVAAVGAKLEGRRHLNQIGVELKAKRENYKKRSKGQQQRQVKCPQKTMTSYWKTCTI